MSKAPPRERAKSNEKPKNEETGKFDIFNYPPTLQRTILNGMKLIHIFHFYLFSEKARTSIQTVRLEKNKREITVYFHSSDSISIFVRGDTGQMKFVSHLKEEENKIELGRSNEIDIDGFKRFMLDPVSMRRTHECLVRLDPIGFCGENKQFDVARTVTWLKTIFNTEFVEMEFSKEFQLMGYGLIVNGSTGFTESVAEMMQGYFPYSDQVLRESKVDFLVALLKSPETRNIDISRESSTVLAKSVAESERFLNFVLKLWEQHSGPGKLRELKVRNFETITLRNVVKDIDPVLNIETMLSDESLVHRREIIDGIDIRSKTGVLATCELTDGETKLHNWG